MTENTTIKSSDLRKAFRFLKTIFGSTETPKGEKRNVLPVERNVLAIAQRKILTAIGKARSDGLNVPYYYELKPTRRVNNIIWDGLSIYYNPDYVTIMQQGTVDAAVKAAIRKEQQAE
jgi:hypothetical protein